MLNTRMLKAQVKQLTRTIDYTAKSAKRSTDVAKILFDVPVHNDTERDEVDKAVERQYARAQFALDTIATLKFDRASRKRALAAIR